MLNDLHWEALSANVLGFSASVERPAQPIADKLHRVEVSADMAGRS